PLSLGLAFMEPEFSKQVKGAGTLQSGGGKEQAEHAHKLLDKKPQENSEGEIKAKTGQKLLCFGWMSFRDRLKLLADSNGGHTSLRKNDALGLLL
ncbi:hypothetical protein U1Q18_031281, partial [Sarracenia purpurea var. burkii]